jgi:hypothetical protein
MEIDHIGRGRALVVRFGLTINLINIIIIRDDKGSAWLLDAWEISPLTPYHFRRIKYNKYAQGGTLLIS